MIFYIILFSKLLALILFSSDYQNELFLPFLKTAIVNFPENPWSNAWKENLFDAFPYHPLMLYFLGLFQLVPVCFNFDGLFQRVFLVLPNLFADVLIYYILKLLFPSREKVIQTIYFSSPIVFYVVYMHGQLDLLPTSFLFLALYLLIKERFVHSGFIFGLAISFKFNVIAALPMFLFYLYRKNKDKFFFFVYPLALAFSIFSLPWYFSESFRKIVLSNPKQDLIFSTIYKIGDYQLIIPIFTTFLIYFKFFSYKKMNPDLLVTWLAILFSVFVLTIPPAPGWYVWTIPFLVYFYLKFVKKERHIIYLSSALNLTYLVFFLFSWQGDYVDLRFLGEEFLPKVSLDRLNGIFFTGLSVSLIANLYAIYGLGVRSNRIYHKPSGILIGIGGDSGAGKSTLLHSLSKLLRHSVTLLEGDGDHRWERGNQNYEKFTHLNPRANYLERQAENLFLLKKGEIIYRPDYDHHSGQFTKPEPIHPAEYIILSGLHSFYLPKMRKVMDIKIFVDTEETLRIHWKIIRDTHKRGYNKDKILKQISDREEDSRKYIQPQKEFADICIEYFSRHPFEIGDENADIKVGLKITMLSEFSIESIAVDLEEKGILFEWNYMEDLQRQYLIFFEPIPSDYLNSLVESTISNREDLIPGEINWDAGYYGTIQYFILLLIFKRLSESREIIS
ncbi:hypothetical protein [Leptospira levettii]|uniref:hypothetical protein n=1 Tax=Leptospira levettii TaxID=2023178 RepID=UPI00223D684B|nr:hypothetical protein [Leptospira levettii]MCW7472073.1 hypothetical protein [Leptospira levettii]